MSWEDFKKEKQQTSSWEEFKKNKEKSVQVSTSENTNAPISQNIRNFMSDTGRTFGNLSLGAKSGTKQSLNFAFKIGENRGKTEQQVKNERVLGSKELTDTEKALYIAQQKNKSVEQKKLNNEVNKNLILPILNNNTPTYNNAKVEEVANNNVLDRSINKDQLKIQENIENQTNNFSRKLAELAPSIGNMGVGKAISAVNPAAGMAYFTTSAGGSYMQDALERGMTREQATTYGAIMGLMEGATEAVGIENLSKAGKGLKALVSGAGVKVAFKGGTKEVAKNSIKTILKDYGIGIADNVMQEAIIEPIQEITAGAIGGKDKADWNDMGQRMLKAGIDGGLTSAIIGGANLGIQSCVGIIEKTKNGQNITQKELQTAVQDASTQVDVEKMITDSTQQQINKYNTLSEQSQSAQNQQSISTQQTVPTIQNNAQNGISEQNNSILNNKDVSMLNYQYEKSDNAKINNLRQDAGKYFNNSEQARNYINMLEQIITDKNVDIRLDDNLKTPDGKMANGSYSDGVITINPNSTKSGEFIAAHELTHAIGTDSMRNIIETYRKSNIEFNTAMENLLQNYNSTELTDEALSDVSAQLFGNQEFITNISQSNPNIFKRIYNEIKYLWHQFRGYKNQNQFIDDLYYKWTQAYNSNNKLNEASNYSIAGKEGMTNAIKADTRNLALERNYNKAQQMQKSGIDNETIRQNTGWFQDRNGDWKFEFSDKDMSLKNIKLEKDKTYKLGDILEHDTLFEIYPELANYNVKFTDLNKPNGVYNIFDKDIKINNNQLNKKQYKSSIEGTLIHEIQHAIQDIENFEGGKSSKGSKLAYYESLGEIEASDTKARFIQEKHENINFADIAPESSKLNPKHKNLDKYLNNRKLLDKAKDGVYNYIKKRNGGSYEFSKENISKNKKQDMGLVDGRKRGRYVDEYDVESITNLGKNNEKIISENNREDRGIYRDRVNKKSQESENNSGSFSLTNDKWNNYLDDNFKSEGTKTNLKDIKNIVPIAKNNKDIKAPVAQVQQNNMEKVLYRTTEQIVNDKKISDLDAIKEESNKVNTPTIKEANKAVNQLENNISPNIKTPTSPTIDLVNKKRSKEKASLKEIKDTLAQKFVNKGHYIDKLAQKTGNKNLTYLYDRTMNTFNEAQISIGDGQVITNEKGTDVEVVGKSIMDIFSEADNSKLSNEFDDYLLNKHNISRYAYEKGVFGKEISATDSQRIVKSYEEKHPEFIKWSKEVSNYNDNNLKDLVRNGLVSKETYNKLREMYSDYVPTFRDITENIAQYQDDSVGGNTLKKATESNKNILSIKESMAEQTLAIKKAIRVNKLGLELYKTLGKESKVTESVSGINFDPVAIQTLAGDVIAKAKDGTNTFMIFQNGEMTEFKISDELYSAFTKDTIQNKINNSEVARTLLTPVEKLSKAQRELLTTYSVGFAFNNPIKDFQDAVFNTKYSSAQFLKNYTKALYNIGTDGSWYQNYKNNGGTANTYFDYEKGILPNKNKRFGDSIKAVNEILEQAPRLAEYISTIENGGNIDEALYNAADITTNFKRGGDVTKAVNKYGANFLNASVQGLDKFYRNLSGQNGWKGYASLAVKAIVWQVAPAVLNGLLLGDDDDYEDLPEYTKDNYFLFKIGDGKFFRIPKGRISSVVGGVARRALETAQGKEVKWKALIDTTINQMAPNNPLKDNIVAPIVQASSNKAWYGGEIVSSRLQKLPVAEQSDESTDKLSKFLGEKLNISPKKINYVLDQYSGGVGDVILPMLTPQAENNILEDKFTTDAVTKNKHVSEYYSLLEDLEKNKNSEKATDTDKLKYMYLSGSSKELGELYQQKREIQNSDLSDKEKKLQVREVQKQINEIVEDKLENVDSIKQSGDIATVGGEKYYKYKKEWKKLSDEEAEKTKGISLNTYANYQNKVAALSDEKKKKSESVSQKDRINILVNANYTSNEKDKIYSQIINKDDDTYQILKKLDNSRNIINQYLDYLQTDLKADREDDGTENGKAISGSKKQKVYNYINSIDSNNMSYAQRLYLTGINTTLSTSDKKQMFTLINESKSLTKSEKLETLDKLQGFTVYKDGKVKW